MILQVPHRCFLFRLAYHLETNANSTAVKVQKHQRILWWAPVGFPGLTISVCVLNTLLELTWKWRSPPVVY